MSIPAPFDAAFYRGLHSDLAEFSDENAYLHYLQHGRAVGRIASPFAQRAALAEHARQAKTKLEIGPFCNPILSGEGVRYLDVLTGDQLRERAKSLGMDPAGCPNTVDYVGSIDKVTDRFDAVLSAHCIEHQPDLIVHLNGVADILNPGGYYYVIIPDKRYCFDHFNVESTVANVLQAHHEKRRVHTLASVVENAALTTHNDAWRHWRGDHGVQPGAPDRVKAGLDWFEGSQGGYIDMHAWYFTPDNFARIMDTLFSLGLSRLRAAAVYDTPFDHQEFCAVLEPG